MTLITAIRFNSREGALLADQRVIVFDTPEVYANTSIKIKTISLDKVKAVIGTSGATPTKREVYKDLQKTLDQNKEKINNREDLIQNFGNVIMDFKRNWMKKHIKNEYLEGIEVEPGKLVPGKEYLEQRIKDCFELKEQIVKQVLDNSFVTLAVDNQGMDIYLGTFNIPYPLAFPEPYLARGSGCLASEQSLAEFFESFPSEKRIDVPPLRGLAALLKAYSHTRRIESVGGPPLIAIIRDQKIYSPPQNNCLLASQIVSAQNKGYLSEAKTSKYLKALLYDGTPWKSAKDEFYRGLGKRRVDVENFLFGFV